MKIFPTTIETMIHQSVFWRMEKLLFIKWRKDFQEKNMI